MSNKKQLTFFPASEPWYSMYKHQLSLFWSPESRISDLKTDRESYKAASAKIRRSIRGNLLYFGIGDGVVRDSIQEIKLDEFNDPMFEVLRRWQLSTEDIHGEAYGHMMNVILEATDEDIRGYTELIMKEPYIAAMIGAVNKWLKNAEQLDADNARAIKIAVLMVLERVYFSGSFGFTYWLNEKYPGKYPGQVQLNVYIDRDENNHGETWSTLFRMLCGKTKFDVQLIIQLMRDAIAACDILVDLLYPEDLEGLRADDMRQYYRYNVDDVMDMMGLPPIYLVKNPLDFMAGRKNTRFRITDLFIVKSNDYKDHNVDTSDNAVILPD
jgi:ribonucleotide reductase beta subunit family protein with ferritin-like domain